MNKFFRLMPVFIQLHPRWKHESCELDTSMSYSDLLYEIQELRAQILRKEEIFDFGICNNEALKKIKERHAEIVKLKRQLNLLMEENLRLIRN